MNSYINNIDIKFIELTNIYNEVLDITNLVTNIDIFESIYTSTLNGYIHLIDSNDLPQFFPIVGGERLKIEMGLPFDGYENYITLDFLIYRMSDREIKSNTTQHYKLWFTSFETLTNIENIISKSFKGYTALDIIKYTLKSLNTDKNLNYDDTIGVFDYISPSIRPFELINTIVKNYSINDISADFIFFESLGKDGASFNFKSISNIFKNESPIGEIEFKQKHKSAKNPFLYTNVPESINFKKSFDIVESKVNGLMSQSIIHHDLLRKRYEIQKYDYNNENMNYKADKLGYKTFDDNLLGKYSEFIRYSFSSSFSSSTSAKGYVDNSNNTSITKKKNRNENSYIKENQSDYTSDVLTDIISKRAVALQEFENNKIYINDLTGDLKYNAGSVIVFSKPNIVYNQQEYIDKYGDNKDLFISGNYLITKSRHNIIKSPIGFEYKNYLEIAKNTFKNSLDIL